ncbi:MAG TPA: lipase maturation factor family protein [Candidatus Acidoferrum sp.]|nr:lipase maturation factor family protein [Candidatus Acidoferrum sp.]
MEKFVAAANWLLGPEKSDERHPGHLWPRWIFLRALGLIYFSAFYSFYFQIRGLIGPDGILPAGQYLQAVASAPNLNRFWFAPTLLWLGTSDRALMLLCWAGLVASLLVVINFWPRASLFVCFVCFLSFIAAAQDFASYQSDGMLLEAGFISLFFAPSGFWPGLAAADAPSRLSRFLLQWEWFRIYFESGVVKLASHDQSWRNLTAMDDYYQNGPLPTWVGYYVQHFPHWFHASTVVLTLAIELFIVWMLFLPRRFRIACFCIVTPFEISIISTANYAFLNYLVLSLGFLLLDDRVIEGLLPQRIRMLVEWPRRANTESPPKRSRELWHRVLRLIGMTVSAIFLGLVFYVATVQLVDMLSTWAFATETPLPEAPVEWLAPFRIADRYGLFAVMTHERYEIEFQGSADGKTWTPYLFRYKPQDVKAAPRIYAPYQPRFEWNLWFASLGSWQQYKFVVWTEVRLLQNSPDVLRLFAGNPFPSSPPKLVRAVIYQYWFTDLRTKREQGTWWRRELLGEYAPAVEMQPNGEPALLNVPTASPPEP